MKITSIKQQVKNPDRASIFVDGKYSFSLTLNDLVSEKLKISQEIDDQTLKRLKKLSEDGKIKARSLEWVMNRPRSTREFADYLKRKKVEPSFTESLISEFTKKGYIDDTKFTVWFVDVLKRRGKSERAIQSELYKKGISREVIAEYFEKDPDDEKYRLNSLIDKKQHIQRYKQDPLKFKQFLLRQGFSYDDINTVLRERSDRSEGGGF